MFWNLTVEAGNINYEMLRKQMYKYVTDACHVFTSAGVPGANPTL